MCDECCWILQVNYSIQYIWWLVAPTAMQATLAEFLFLAVWPKENTARRKKKWAYVVLMVTQHKSITLRFLNNIFEGYIISYKDMKNGNGQWSQWQMAIIEILLKAFGFVYLSWCDCSGEHLLRTGRLSISAHSGKWVNTGQELDTTDFAADRAQLTVPQCFSRAIQ